MKNRLFHRVLAWMLILTLFISCIVTITVFADTDPPFTFSVMQKIDGIAICSPDDQLDLNFIFTPNNGHFNHDIFIKKIFCKEKEMTDLSVQLPGGEPIRLANGSNEFSFSATVKFAHELRGKEVTFLLIWNDGGADHTEEYVFSLCEAKPQISVSAEYSSFNISPDEELQITYTVCNTGNVPLQAVSVFDADVDACLDRDHILNKSTEDYLNVGEQYSETVTLQPKTSFLSLPYAVFFFEGKESEKVYAQETQINIDSVMPNITLSCDTYSVSEKDSVHVFTYTIENKGNIPLKNVRVYNSADANADLVEVIAEILPGTTHTGKYEYCISQSGFYRFKVVYTYDGADGDQTMQIKTNEAITIPDEVTFRISDIRPKFISAPNEKLTFVFEISNGNTAPLRSAEIVEENGLCEPVTIGTIEAAAADGTPKIVTQEITVTIPEDNMLLEFSLKYTLPSATGDRISQIKTGYTVQFNIPMDLPTNTATTAASPTPITQESNNGNAAHVWLIILLVLLSLLLIAAIIFLIIILINKNRETASASVIRRRTDVAGLFDDENGVYFNDDDDGSIPFEQVPPATSFDAQFDDEESLDSTKKMSQVNNLSAGNDLIAGDEYDDEGVKIFKKKH